MRSLFLAAIVVALSSPLGAQGPGQEHAALEPFVGKWDLEVRFRMAPAAPWQKSKSESEFTWILGKRFLRERVRGAPMPQTGVPFEGLGILGHDGFEKRYELAWMENTGTAMTYATGAMNGAGKKLTLRADATNPMTGKPMKIRIVRTVEGKDRHVLRWYTQDQGAAEFHSVEIVYTRR